jgi:RNA polymerase sigma factor (sigma-70 family)
VPDKRREDFETTALPFARPLYATALRITGRAEDAFDVVQETFLRAFRTFDNFTEGTNPKAWLFTILRSVSANRWRRERRQPRSFLSKTGRAVSALWRRRAAARDAARGSEPSAEGPPRTSASSSCSWTSKA